jgi:uncharacterized ferredoxin-like protein
MRLLFPSLYFMKIESDSMEKDIALGTAKLMAAAARTSPKARGKDNLHTFVLTSESFGPLIAEMRKLGTQWKRSGFARDAANLEKSIAIVFIGTKLERISLGQACGFCGFPDCEANKAAGAICAYNPGDLGIAVGSAAAVAADHRVDTRVMYSAGKAALSLGLFPPEVKIAFGIPVSISGKSPYFDRVPS